MIFHIRKVPLYNATKMQPEKGFNIAITGQSPQKQVETISCDSLDTSIIKRHN